MTLPPLGPNAPARGERRRMSPEAQRIAIAKACGWTYTKTVNNPDPTPYGRLPKGEHPTMHGKEVEWDLPLPSYLSDLNAMHEAEKVLLNSKKSGIWTTYLYWLEVVCDVPMHHATAAQRAEAFLRTLNLWPNTK